jgi:hypothetical protein
MPNQSRTTAINNSYELSATQQTMMMRGAVNNTSTNHNTAPLDDWDVCRASLLRENPETGSFYIPSGSGELIIFCLFKTLY